MNAAKIKMMSGDECMKAIRLIDSRAIVNQKPVSKADQALIEKLQARIHELDPDGDE